MNARIARRQFIKQTSFTAAGFWLVGGQAAFGKKSSNEKLDVGFIGVANQAGYDLNEVAKEIDSVNVAALCDIDDNLLAKAKEKYPGAKTYNDFRRLLDQKGLDAIVVGTPDHTHAVAAVAALKSGRHVYCEKPLARTLSETRIIVETA